MSQDNDGDRAALPQIQFAQQAAASGNVSSAVAMSQVAFRLNGRRYLRLVMPWQVEEVNSLDPLMCDVVGCGKPAAWARVIDLNATHEDFLCDDCWKRLHTAQPHEGQCYVACGDIEHTRGDNPADNPDELDWMHETIVIG